MNLPPLIFEKKLEFSFISFLSPPPIIEPVELIILSTPPPIIALPLNNEIELVNPPTITEPILLLLPLIELPIPPSIDE